MAFHETKKQDFEAIRLKLASADEIHAWSHGEVLKPETINYRTQKPEKDGLFCERIFGPSKDWECYCGKYKRIRYKGIVCDKCGVEVTRSIVRRERMGHIDLAAPVSHIWFLRGIPSKIGLVLDLSVQSLERVIYFASFILTEVNDELRHQTLHQIEQEFKNKKKEIEADFNRVVAQVMKEKNEALAVAGERAVPREKAEKKAEQELINHSVNRDEQLRELAEAVEQARTELQELHPMQIISESYYQDLSLKYGHVFDAGIGAETIRKLLEKMDLDEEIKKLELEIDEGNKNKNRRLFRRLKLLRNLKVNKIRPESMVLTTVPVIPPDLRPMVQLDGGRFAASDLNDLYRRVINRNNRLKRLIELRAPEVICRNEKRMLQEAVDALIDNNARHGKTVTASTGQKRQLKSLADMLKGKQGRFRQNLLGKRVDYSGRSVIVVGPHLKLHQCGLPKTMALELYKPFVISELIAREYAHNIRSASRFIESGRAEVWDILEEVTKNSHVFLNRAPTLHRLGIQAFQPILIEGKAIQIHPLVCAAFNADFDGDQMAVHLPLSSRAKWEAEHLMLSTQNLLKPATGEPVVSPAQDIVLGSYYLTLINPKEDPKTVKAFSSPEEAVLAYGNGFVGIQEHLRVLMTGEILETSVGRILFNRVLPKALGFQNATMDKKALKNVISDVLYKCGRECTVQLLDDIKEMSFEYVTKSGLSWGMMDTPVPAKKQEILAGAEQEALTIEEQYEMGLLTDEERHAKIIEIWSRVKDVITEESKKALDPFGPVFAMINSGARGSWAQTTQMMGMKGLVNNPSGDIIELPVKGSFNEGFDVLEYFISTHGAREGLSDTALRTANSGYLTRRLVDVAQDIVVLEENCKDKEGSTIRKDDADGLGETLSRRLVGRVLLEDAVDPKTKSVVVKKGALVTEEELKALEAADLSSMRIRSVLTCKSGRGVCQKCYGYDLGHNQLVAKGTAVGIIAAQSIGEPGTQLTMRTFHTGGVVGQDITQGLPRVEELFEARSIKKPAIISEVHGKVSEIREKDGKIRDVVIEVEGKKDDEKTKIYEVHAGQTLFVREGDLITVGQMITEGSIDLHELFALRGAEEVQRYIMREIQYIYSSQGQKLHDKHIEIILRQMFSRFMVKDPGDTELLGGDVVTRTQLFEANEEAKSQGGKPAKEESMLLGITKVSLSTDSFLSAASFQETQRVLIDAAIFGKMDRLRGLKENVIIGRLIPAGTGYNPALMVGLEKYLPQPKVKPQEEVMVDEVVPEPVAKLPIEAQA